MSRYYDEENDRMYYKCAGCGQQVEAGCGCGCDPEDEPDEDEGPEGNANDRISHERSELAESDGSQLSP